MGSQIPLAHRMADIEPFHVMALLARAHELQAAGRDVVHMEIGEPDFASPDAVVAAGVSALTSGRTRYTAAVGIPELREAIAAHYARRFGLQIDPARIVVTPGASGALLLALAVTVNPGEEVLMTDPGYPCNRHFVRFLEGQPVSVPVDAASRYQLTAGAVADNWGEQTRAVMLASPSNPTGTTLAASELAAILDTVRAHNGYLILDEIYQGLLYEGAPSSALAISDEVIVINSFSKYFYMTGWRLGWLVVPTRLCQAIERLAQNLFLSPSAPAQYAALAALDPVTDALLEERREAFVERRDFLIPALRNIGFEIPITPDGAFYIYADCSRLTDDSFAFARELLESQAVAITPGIDFGVYRPERHVRFAYTTSLERLAMGTERIAEFVASR
ncbi:MAG: pyridoxal phosphate-dependent aminotransferase [Gammaproteobacteria bacterium]|nr:pyridoxal phosphate-dependent aminotransferase [Gammaproteobacteria bacterium]